MTILSLEFQIRSVNTCAVNKIQRTG